MSFKADKKMEAAENLQFFVVESVNKTAVKGYAAEEDAQTDAAERNDKAGKLRLITKYLVCPRSDMEGYIPPKTADAPAVDEVE